MKGGEKKLEEREGYKDGEKPNSLPPFSVLLNTHTHTERKEGGGGGRWETICIAKEGRR